MKQTTSQAFFACIYLLLSACLFTSCEPHQQKAKVDERVQDSPASSPAPVIPPPPAPEPSPAPRDKGDINASVPDRSPASAYKGITYDRAPAPAPATSAPRSQKEKEYEIKLGVDKIIIMPGAGMMKFWIGLPEYSPEFPEHMNHEGKPIPLRGKTVQVTPHAPSFKVEPKISNCLAIDPTGTDLMFVLTPTTLGEFTVTAEVNQYDSDDCKGTAKRRATDILSVNVIVNPAPAAAKHDEVIDNHKRQLIEILWEEALKFYREILILFFAVLLFLIRGRLKKWFGFEK